MSAGGPIDAERIEATIFALLEARAVGASVCPSDVARALDPRDAAWRALMPAVREVARGLARAGRLRVTQRDRDVSLAPTWRGAIRLRRP